MGTRVWIHEVQGYRHGSIMTHRQVCKTVDRLRDGVVDRMPYREREDTAPGLAHDYGSTTTWGRDGTAPGHRHDCGSTVVLGTGRDRPGTHT